MGSSGLLQTFSSCTLLLFFCFFQLLYLPSQILCTSFNGDANSTASCSSSFMQCGSSGNISYPFGGSASCAASPSYVLSNCASSSSAQASWDSFSDTAVGVVGPPTVTAMDQVVPYGAYYERPAESYIQLSWNKTLIELGYCAPPFSSANLSLYNIPSSINLTHFPDSAALQFSSNIDVLLFNCTHNTSDVVAHLGSENFVAESNYISKCRQYKALCTSLAETPCIQWLVPTKELMLQHVLDSLACSHFMLAIDEVGNNQWSTGSIELIWTDIQCQKCQTAFGDCIYDVAFPAKFNYCRCWANNTPFDFNTQTCSYSWNDDCVGGLLHCNTGAKIGFEVAAIVVVLGVVLGILIVTREHIRAGFLWFVKVIIPIAINILKKSLRKLQSISYESMHSLNIIDFDGLTERPMEYSYGSIASATKSFSSLVGEGGCGAVYKGTLNQASSHGGLELQIAVKVLESKSKHRKQQFLNEVVTIGKIHHVNVVRLLGFCMREDHEMLVYEYVVNGSLDRWLFEKKGKAQEQVLDWEQRYTIALGIARGLSYLHEECRHRTVHCDIKPQNILLDEHMHPKIADFGLARLMGRDESKVLTLAKGTPGYIAPEFWMGGESQLSTKFDVYSYGMVLLELISGQRNFNAEASGSSFPAKAFKAAMEGDMECIVDARLDINTCNGDEAGKQTQWHQIKTAALVALWCIQDQTAMRPHMSEVVKYLEGGAAVSECPPQPTISISVSASASSPPAAQEWHNSGSNQEDDCTPLSGGR